MKQPDSRLPKTPSHLGIVEWLRPGEYQRVEELLDHMKRMSVSRIRTGISWADWFTPEGQQWYGWLMPKLGKEVEILPCFLYTPPSIALVPKTSSPPKNPKDFADFIDLFTSRFGGLYDWVELWNEPNNFAEWDCTLDPHWRYFAEMVGGAAYWAKQLGKKTVLGGMSPIDPHWLCMMFERDVMKYIDAVGIHGFPDTFDYVWKGWQWNIDMVREVLDNHGSKAQIWITEAGFSTWQHDEMEQLRKFLDFVDAPADRAYWYGLDDLDQRLPAVDRFHLDDREYYFGLRKEDGNPKLLLRLLQSEGLEGARSLEKMVTRNATSAPARRPVLITGGAGFIGTNLAHRLMQEGETVHIFDSLCRPGVEKNLRWLKEMHGDRLIIEVADTRNARMVGDAVRKAGKVFHFAAQVAVTTSLVDPVHDLHVNGIGTVNVLEAIRRCDEPPPLIFTSTNKVYGDLKDLPLRETRLTYEPDDLVTRVSGVNELQPLSFHSPYGCSKGTGDQYVLDYARSYGLAVAVFRMSCIYGPHQFGTEDQGWVAHFLIQAIKGNQITLYGDGKQVRDILFVDDLVEAFLLGMKEMPKIRGEAFNIGGGCANVVSLLELLEIIGELEGFVPEVRFSGWRRGDQRYYVSDVRKFARMTGWSPRIDVYDGVRRLHEWLREQYPSAGKRVMHLSAGMKEMHSSLEAHQ